MKNLRLLTLLASTLLLNYLSKVVLKTDEVVLSSLTERYGTEQINEILNLKEKWEWLGYAIIPLLLLLKISIIAALIDIGCFFLARFTKE